MYLYIYVSVYTCKYILGHAIAGNYVQQTKINDAVAATTTNRCVIANGCPTYTT